jgi:hypothetical protein
MTPVTASRTSHAALGQERDTAQSAGDPGYLTETGQAASEDGPVAPIIGGLPAVEGSAWDIGAPLDERGASLAEELGSVRQARPAARPRAAAESSSAEDGSKHDSAPGACAREGVP